MYDEFSSPAWIQYEMLWKAGHKRRQTELESCKWYKQSTTNADVFNMVFWCKSEYKLKIITKMR